MYSQMQKIGKGAIWTCAAGVGVDLLVRKYLQSYGVDPSCSRLDLLLSEGKRLREGYHFGCGLGENIAHVMDAVRRMKSTQPQKVELKWCSRWEQRYSRVTGLSCWARRGSFVSPVAELLPEEAQHASVWEVRGNEPSSESTSECRPLPLATNSFGLQQLNEPAEDKSTNSCEGRAIVILPDFGGEFCNRTFPVAERVAAQLPEVPVFLMEMPFRGPRKPSNYVGGVIPTVSDLLLMGCSIIEECRSLLFWLSMQGHTELILSGLSMGGHMAALVSCCSPHVTQLALLMPSHSAEANFLDGGLMGMRSVVPPAILRPFLYEATHIETYPALNSLKQIVLVALQQDGYAPFWSSERLQNNLEERGVPVSFHAIRGGHVSGFLAHQGDFASAIVDALRGM